MVCRSLYQSIGHTITQSQEPPDGKRSLSLPSMPTEILSSIIDLVDPETLPALRLTNKRLCAISNTPFATMYFSECRHVQSAHSMDALVDITAHPFFGRFVKTVIISGSRPEVRQDPFLKKALRSCAGCTSHKSSSLCEHPAPHHIALSFEQLRCKLEKLFSNLAHHSSSVTIGVRDDARMCYGSFYYNADCARISKYSLEPYPQCPERDECNSFIKAYGEILEAAGVSGCEIEGIKLFTSMKSRTDTSTHDQEVYWILRHIVSSLPEALSFELNLESWAMGSPGSHFKYNHNTGEFSLSGFNFWYPDAAIVWPGALEAMRMIIPLLNRPMVQFTLERCYFAGPELLEMFYSPTLKELILHDVTFCTQDLNPWSRFLKKLSRTTQLKGLEVSGCRYMAGRVSCEEGKIWLRLPSGRYEVKPELGHFSSFFLAPSGDFEQRIVLSDETSISPQLKELADQVAQLELDKIAQIESDAYVYTNIVGFSKRPNSAEDIVSGEDGQGDESGGDGDAHDEHPENDNQNEHPENDNQNELRSTI